MAKNISEQGFHDHQSYKWVVLDGDIDAVWIESMNTVMDDNKVLFYIFFLFFLVLLVCYLYDLKVLTLVSNERIPLSEAMRMVFEINSLKNATPATVSRAGILYINESDIGWKPFMESWLNKRDLAGTDPSGLEKSCLPGLFDKYIDATNDSVRKGFKEVRIPSIFSNEFSLILLIKTVYADVSTQ